MIPQLCSIAARNIELAAHVDRCGLPSKGMLAIFVKDLISAAARGRAFVSLIILTLLFLYELVYFWHDRITLSISLTKTREPKEILDGHESENENAAQLRASCAQRAS
jgi:hypothetical protein